MKKLSVIPVFLIVLFLSIGCGNSEPPYPPEIIRKSYIQNFIKIDTLLILERFNLKMNGNVIDDSRSDLIGFYEKRSFSVDERIYLLISGEWKEKVVDNTPAYYFNYTYDEKYCKLIGDTSYNSYHLDGFMRAPIAIIDTLSSLQITCNKDYDRSHPAGSILNDLFFIYFENPYEVVKNHYRQPEGGFRLEYVNYSKMPHLLTGGVLSEMTFADKPFIGNNYICALLKAPEQTDEYVFKIRLTKTTGEYYEVSSIPFIIQGYQGV